MRRREFIALVGGAAAALPLAARAQQPPTTTIGFVHSASATFTATLTAGFEQGLKEAGYVNVQNLTIEYRWAEGQYDRLPSIIADLIEHRSRRLRPWADRRLRAPPWRRRPPFQSFLSAPLIRLRRALCPVLISRVATLPA
jgi:hypothetical protein